MKLSGAQLVAFPTETVWGLGALPTADGLAALYAAKQRDTQKPVQVSCSNAEKALALCQMPETLQSLLPFWPGPLSAVVPAAAGVPPQMAPGGYVGLRFPDHPAALSVLADNGGYLLTTSLNRSGEPPVSTAAEAKALGLADIITESGPAPLGLASTVIRWTPGGWVLLREGAVSPAALAGALGYSPKPAAQNGAGA